VLHRITYPDELENRPILHAGRNLDSEPLPIRKRVNPYSQKGDIGLNSAKHFSGGGAVLKKVASLGGLFTQKQDHPLADAREVRKILNELPKDNAFKALDEVAGWLESVVGVDNFPPDRLFEVAQQMEEAAQPHLKRLSREYFQAARLSRSEEKRLWSINHGFWTLLAAAYERCYQSVREKPQPGELSKAVLPVLVVGLISALGKVLKWEQFHYGPLSNELWRRMGQALLAADEAGVGGKAVALPGKSGMTSPALEYLKVMVFQAASVDSLLPLQIELAERLIVHFLPGFVFTDKARQDSVYWVDLKLAQPPLRLARMPAQAEATQRFIKPGAAHAAMRDMLVMLERGGDMPPEVDLGAQYPVKLLVAVLRHLAIYLAPIPPQRQHTRHRVMHRMSVLNGLVNSFVVFSGEFGGRPAGLQMESWVVENVSRGGFGAVLGNIPGDWLKVGALIAMQPEGGDNWLPGVVRRYHRQAENEARVGIQALATKVLALELRARAASSYGAAAATPALMLLDGNDPDEFRVILPPASFDPRESMEYVRDGCRFLLTPVSLIEQTVDYELVCYRQTALG
jgi:hypothetical protein